MSDWVEISVIAENGEAAESVAQILQRYAYQGVSVEQLDIPPDTDDGEVPPPQRMVVRGYLPQNERIEAVKEEINAVLSLASQLVPFAMPEYRVVREEDWAEAWKVHYHPIRIGRKLVVRPLWTEAELQPDDIEIALDPGMAFGTGTHPTTQLCLEALEDMVRPATQILDLGCGSGILAIAAAKLGASHIWALDIDPIAVEAAQANCEQNGVADKITVQTGSLDSVITSARRFDLVVVNILAKIILQLCEQRLGETVRPGGRAIFSGIIESQVEEVEAALRKTGLEPSGRRQIGDWVLIEAYRPST
ncbi:MAG: 50S ribosomal protein L11 methyltransferase [Chloroflexi bacterium]|nr:MAG: 50S ribosomal protein L11 methyltransferase [Chloroflexota bacterium]